MCGCLEFGLPFVRIGVLVSCNLFAAFYKNLVRLNVPSKKKNSSIFTLYYPPKKQPGSDERFAGATRGGQTRFHGLAGLT